MDVQANVDVQKKLDEIVAAVESARSMPMSASCVVNRAELLGMLEQVRAALPDSLAHARAVLGEREQVVVEARREAERVLAAAHAERGSLISDTQVARQSQEQAEKIMADARRDSEEIRAEADDYVDSKLANFEVVLTKTIAAVDRGREKLLGRGPGVDDHGNADLDVPERSHDPEELRRQADEYVDTKLASFEAVLGKTLEAVGRGRQKLLGRRPTDELGGEYDGEGTAHGAPHVGQSDSEYVAALAAGRQDEQPRQQAAYDGYGYGGYQDDGYGGAPARPHEPAPYTQDGYRTQAAYGQDYGWQQAPYGAQGDPGYGHAQGAEDPQAPYGAAPPYGRGDGDGGHPAQHQGDGGGYPPQGYGDGQGLDETSFFDTSVIDVQRLRELDGGR